LAAGAIYLVLKIRLKKNWTFEELTGLNDAQVRPCAKYLCALIQAAEFCSLDAVKRKFSTMQHYQVSKL
jgi:cyclin B